MSYLNILETERALIASLKGQIAELSALIDTSDRVAVLASSSQFQDFLKEIKRLKDISTKRMTEAAEDHELRRAQGAVQAYSEILEIVSDATANKARLVNARQRKQDYLDTMVTPSGGLKPTGITP